MKVDEDPIDEASKHAKAIFAQISKATIGFAKLNIIDSDIKLSFGKYNPREKNELQVARLCKAMKTDGVQWYRSDSMLSVLIPNSNILVPDTFTKDSTLGPQLPTLKLTDEGKASYPEFVLASGQHRYAALRALVAQHGEKIKRMKSKISQLEKEADKKREAHDELLDMRAALRIAESRVVDLGWWGVILYDESEHHIFFLTMQSPMTVRTDILLENGGEAAYELSRNKTLYQYGETESEKLMIFIGQLIAVNGDSEAEKRIRATAYRGDSRLGQVLANHHTFDFLKSLISYGKHFGFHKVTTTSWIQTNMLHVSGGVSQLRWPT